MQQLIILCFAKWIHLSLKCQIPYVSECLDFFYFNSILLKTVCYYVTRFWSEDLYELPGIDETP